MRGVVSWAGGEERTSISESEEDPGPPLLFEVEGLDVGALGVGLDLAMGCEAKGSSLCSSSSCGVGGLVTRAFFGAGALSFTVDVDVDVDALGRPRGLDGPDFEEGRGGLNGLGGMIVWN